MTLREIEDITQRVLNEEPDEEKRANLENLHLRTTVLYQKKHEKVIELAKKIHTAQFIKTVLFCSIIGIFLIPLFNYFWLNKQIQRLNTKNQKLVNLNKFTYSPPVYRLPTNQNAAPPFVPVDTPPEVNDNILSFFSPAELVQTSVVSKAMWEWTQTNLKRTVEQQFLPLRESFGCYSSAQARECAIAHQFTSINSTALSSFDLELVVAKCPPIKNLFINRSSLTQQVVSNLKELTYLGLYDQGVYSWEAATPEEMEAFNSLKNLPQLHLHLRFPDGPVDEHLQALQSFSKLKSLFLECTHLEPEWLMPVAHLTNLESLEIVTHFSRCSEESWNATWQELIQKLSLLKNLTINSNGLFDAGFQDLFSLTELESIDLTKCVNITDGIVNHVLPVPYLKTLKFTEKALSPEAQKLLEDAGKTIIFCPTIHCYSDCESDTGSVSDPDEE